jgi:hypothetical protein
VITVQVKEDGQGGLNTPNVVCIMIDIGRTGPREGTNSSPCKEFALIK